MISIPQDNVIEINCNNNNNKIKLTIKLNNNINMNIAFGYFEILMRNSCQFKVKLITLKSYFIQLVFILFLFFNCSCFYHSEVVFDFVILKLFCQNENIFLYTEIAGFQKFD